MDLRIPATRSLALRLATAFALSIAIVAGLYLAVQSHLSHRFANFVTQRSLMGQAREIAEAVEVDRDGRITVRLESADAEGFDAYFANLKYRVLDREGRVLASSDGNPGSLLPVLPPDHSDDLYTQTEVDRTPFHVATVRHRIHGRDYWIQVGRSDRFAKLAEEAIVPAITEAVGITAALAVVVLALLSYWGVRSLLRPIRLVSRAAGTVGHDNLSARLPVDPLPSEVRPLVIAFNEVLERLELAFGAQQRFFANAAHELKTPLALLRAQLEAGGADVPTEVLADVDALGRTVNQLLHVAEVTAGRPLVRQQICLDALTHQVIGFLSWRAKRADVSLQVARTSASVVVMADEGEVFVLLKNLIENAVDHSPRGGVVRVSLSATSVSVDDQGAGVAEDHRGQVFERFWRAPTNRRPGAGLGLAICMEVARAHGWTLACKSSDMGGACFLLEVRDRLNPSGA